jgi:hypothetical protein
MLSVEHLPGKLVMKAVKLMVVWPGAGIQRVASSVLVQAKEGVGRG